MQSDFRVYIFPHAPLYYALLLVVGIQNDGNGVNDTIVTLNVTGERCASKADLSNNGIVNKGLAEFAFVGKRVSLQGWHGAVDAT